MSYTPIPLAGQVHNNQQLFSDHYLSVILPARRDWQLLRGEAQPVMKQVAEIKKVFKREIPVAERDQWDDWLSQQRAEHEPLTAEIVRLEIELNEQVYALYDLTPDEIKIIEDVTKYEYGEV